MKLDHHHITVNQEHIKNLFIHCNVLFYALECHSFHLEMLKITCMLIQCQYREYSNGCLTALPL